MERFLQTKKYKRNHKKYKRNHKKYKTKFKWNVSPVVLVIVEVVLEFLEVITKNLLGLGLGCRWWWWLLLLWWWWCRQNKCLWLRWWWWWWSCRQNSWLLLWGLRIDRHLLYYLWLELWPKCCLGIAVSTCHGKIRVV